MEEIRLITDSSSNDLTDQKQNLTVVPLSISLGKKTYRDDEQLNIADFLKSMETNQVAGKTACPSINEWLEALDGCDKAIVVAMTSGLSGTYASAIQARDIYLEKHPDAQIIVVDSRTAGPEMAVIIEGIEKLLQSDLRWVDLEEAIAKMRTQTHLLFVLQNLHNLSLNGRVSPAVAKIAGLLHINIVGKASKEGKFEQIGKARGMKKALREVVKAMKAEGYQGGEVIIDHCENEADSENLKKLILADFPDVKIKIRPMRGLCSFYAEEGGMMIGYHE
ncbi:MULTISPECIES: DegV family protein [Lactobacillus]|uniref:DegV family protein n=1 Tax=Lactobacillus xujianguonis TaxID=2495899 RepID=A0A437ST43_9LACO|nr:MULTISPECIES: DegV family protein [Lactobacillus]RVU70111.1 DegV family protein [Lactobacillus xujianguonis]RVU73081.1 DegV family protein [Lactobacillus xujianguonis]